MTDAEKLEKLERTLAYGGHTHTVADVLQMLEDGSAQWWCNGDGCIVTEMQNYPQFKAINYWLIFGELQACLALEHDINPRAIDWGCSLATAAGRRGWGRVAAATGWRPHSFNFVKPLIEGWHDEQRR